MTTLRQAWARLVSFFHKQELDREFDEELAAHIDLATRDHIRQGMPPSEARRLALIRLGGIESSKEVHRESRGLPWLDSVVQDVRYALRALRRSPGFTVTAVAMLALGIGVNVAVFTLTNALFKRFPFDRNDRILYIHSRTPSGYVSWPDFQDWRTQARSFDGMAVVNGLRISLTDGHGPPESYNATEVSSGAFKLLGQKPVIGRDFAPADETLGAPPVTILSYNFWEHRYGKDPAIVGTVVRINGVPTTVVGVMAQGFSFPRRQDLWVPLSPTPELVKREARDLWFAFGRLADGVSPERARAEMETIGNRLASAYPLTNRGFPPVMQDFTENFIGGRVTRIFESMLAAVVFVLLIACANLANLMLARALRRSREISLRIALGAGRWRIIRQLLIESVMLSATGGVFGWAIAKLAVRTYEFAVFPSGNPPWIDYTMDYRVLAYLLVISVGTGVLFGLAPAGRLRNLDVNAALKDGGRGAAGMRDNRLSALLVSGEMALAVVLLAGAGVMIRSFLNIYTADVGVKPTNVLTAYLALPDSRYSDVETQIAFYDQLKLRLERFPGVESVATAITLPTSAALRRSWQLPGKPQQHSTLSVLIVGPAYFDTLGAPLLSGREFTDRDEPSATPVVIVNQRFAARYWPGEDPLGKHLRLFHGDTPEEWLTVVGVAPNIIQNDRTQQEIDPLAYVPYRQKPGGYMWVIARTAFPPENLAPAFRQEVQALDSDLPIFSLQPLAQRLQENYRDNGSIAVLFLVFAAIALLLASVGLYAVVAHSVSRRTQEIGIRIAVGAATRDILRLVFRQGMLPLAIGLTLGLASSFAVNRVLKAELVQVSPADPIALAAASAMLALSAALGCLIPARRAMRVDPVVALRHE